MPATPTPNASTSCWIIGWCISIPLHPTLRATLAATTTMRLLPLPTYAPWTNPVERVWRKLAQEVLHLHRCTDDWPGLHGVVQDWLDRATQPSDALLRYVGLLCPP